MSTCLECGLHYERTGMNQRYCSISCRNASASVRLPRKRKAAKVEPPWRDGKCDGCDQPIKRFIQRQRWCSACRSRGLHNPRKNGLIRSCEVCSCTTREKPGKWVRWCPDCRSEAYAAEQKARGAGFPRTAECRTCGNEFQQRHPNHKACSRKCTFRWEDKTPGARMRRALYILIARGVISREEIYKRDQNTCQLCHQPVDMTLKLPNKMAATLDHIVAVTNGGTNAVTNLQLAHFKCNNQKRAA